MPFVALNNFDQKKLASELVRQLRRHRALDAFLEMVSTDTESLTGGDETLLQDWVVIPPIKLAWGTNGSAPMYSLLRDEAMLRSGWRTAMQAITHTLESGDAADLYAFLRSSRRFGPLVVEAAASSPATLIAAACTLRTGAGRATVSEQGVVVETNSALKNNIEVCDSYVRVNHRYYEGLGRVDWDLVAPNTKPVSLPRLLTAIVTDALMLDDPMVTSMLAAYTLTLTEGTPSTLPTKSVKLPPKPPRKPWTPRWDQPQWPPPEPPTILEGMTPEDTFRRITESLVPRMKAEVGVYHAMDYFELYPNKGHEMPVQPVNTPGKTEAKVYETLKMADAKYIGEIIKGHGDSDEVSVNLLELFNFYVAMYPYQTPSGFRALTRQPAIVKDRPNVVPMTVSRLRRWHLQLHDTKDLMERC